MEQMAEKSWLLSGFRSSLSTQKEEFRLCLHFRVVDHQDVRLIRMKRGRFAQSSYLVDGEIF